MMIPEKIFDLHSLTRQKLLGYLEHLSAEQLVDIPYGFRNNIWWNIVHVIVTQQLLCYYLSNNEMLIERHWVEKFKKGTAPDPEEVPSPEEIEEIKTLLISTQQQLKAHYQQGYFETHQLYPTSYGFTIENIEDAILFNNTHESMHLGTIIAINKLV